jgi:hypothetical protein
MNAYDYAWCPVSILILRHEHVKLIAKIDLFAAEIHRAIIYDQKLPWSEISRAYSDRLPLSLKMDFLRQRLSTKISRDSVLVSAVQSTIRYLKEGYNIQDEKGYSDALFEAAATNMALPFLLHLLQNTKSDCSAPHHKRIVFEMQQITSQSMVAAAAVGDLATFVSIQKTGASINANSFLFGSAINAAIRWGQLHFVRYMLNHGAEVLSLGYPRHDVDYWPHDKKSLFQRCSTIEECGRSGDTRVAMEIFEARRAEIFDENRDLSLWTYSRAVSVAARHNYGDMVNLFLTEASNHRKAWIADISNEILWEAAFSGHLHILQTILLKTNVDINKNRTWPGNALERAAAGGHPSTISHLLSNGSNPKAWKSAYFSAIGKAAGNGHFSAVHLLIEAGAEFNARGEELGYSIFSALRRGNVAMVRFLLEHCGAVIDEDDATIALSTAICRGIEDVVRFLIEDAGLSPNLPLSKHPTYRYPIQEALNYGHFRVARLLLKLGARWDKQLWESEDAEKWVEMNGKGGCDCKETFETNDEVNRFNVDGFSHFQKRETNPLKMFKDLIGVEEVFEKPAE